MTAQFDFNLMFWCTGMIYMRTLVVMLVTIGRDSSVKPIGKGKPTTMADGMDVQRVNLWSTTHSNRVTTSHLTNGKKVIILKDEDPYYLIETANGDGRKGYCMKGFVIKSN